MVTETLGGLADDFISSIRKIAQSVNARSGVDLASSPVRFVYKITLGRQLGLVIIVMGEVSLRSDSTNSNEY